jgi:hypothetical protein
MVNFETVWIVACVMGALILAVVTVWKAKKTDL